MLLDLLHQPPWGALELSTRLNVFSACCWWELAFLFRHNYEEVWSKSLLANVNIKELKGACHKNSIFSLPLFKSNLPNSFGCIYQSFDITICLWTQCKGERQDGLFTSVYVSSLSPLPYKWRSKIWLWRLFKSVLFDLLTDTNSSMWTQHSCMYGMIICLISHFFLLCCCRFLKFKPSALWVAKIKFHSPHFQQNKQNQSNLYGWNGG